LIDWCQVKLECPTCKQPFQNFRHTIQTRPTGDQIYTPDPPAAPVENPRVEQMDLIVVNEGLFESWVIRMANRMPIVLPMPMSSHERLNDPGFRLLFFTILSRHLDINIIDMDRRDH
jgi:E3 ubiquitin-protein ligase Topors